MAMLRKVIGLLARTPIKHKIEDMEFCSHRYEIVAYYDSYSGKTISRYTQTRDVCEVITKTMNWLGHRGGEYGELGRLSAQGNNLLVNCHYLRLPRLLGMAYKAIAPPVAR